MATPFSSSQANFRLGVGKNLFVIYYGWLIEDADGTPGREANLIAEARPDLVIASFYTFEPKYPNLSPQVRDLLHGAGVRLIAYVDTNYAQREAAVVEAEVKDYLAQGVDGIFYDQVYNFLDDQYTEYYTELYQFVHSQDKLVIVNTGIGQPGEEIMKICDILMVEHAWQELYQDNPWFTNYPPQRFMGNSSNEHENQVDYAVAVRDTQTGWANGVGWHFSTDHYIELPDWFLDYTASLGYGGPATRPADQ